MKRLKKAYESAPAWAFEPHGPCIIRFSSDWVRDRVRYGHISLDCFPSLRTINMYPMVFVKEERHHVSQTTTLGASPPLILGFHPSKHHAALIVFLRSGQHCSCLYLGITRTEAFFMASNASYPDVRSMASSRSIVLYCLSSTNIMLFFVQSRFNPMLVLVV